MEDREIVDLYWQRSDRAIRETERKYGRYCQTIAYNITASREDAEECVSDTWLAAWNAMPTKRPAKLSAFLGRVVRNLALDRLRGEMRQKRGGGELPLALEELAECVPGGGSAEQAVELQELSAAVAAFVRALPEPEKQVFAARYYALVPLRVIAEKSGFTQAKVKSMLHRTRLRLRAELEEEGLC